MILNINRTEMQNPYYFRFKFTSKELDSETGLYYFGARYYNPDISIWLSVDPLSDKYPSLSPYNYCANNPLKFVDPDGRDIELTFFKGANRENSQKAMTFLINNSLDGQFEAYYTKGKNGGNLLKLKPTKGGGDLSKMSKSAQAFYSELSTMINNKEVTATIDVFYGNSEINTGNYMNNAVDIADIMQFNVSGNNVIENIGATQAGKLIHEFSEQFAKARQGIKKGSSYGYLRNHQIGIQSENRVNENTRLNDTQPQRGVYQTIYREKDGSNTTVRMYNSSSGILKVQQRKPKGRLR